MRAVGLHHADKKRKGAFARAGAALKSPTYFDHMMIYIAIIYPFTMAPQIYLIATTGDVGGVSMLTNILKSIFALPWIYYGFLHKSRPVVYTNTLWFVGYMIVLIQTGIYG